MTNHERSQWITKYQQIEECLRGNDVDNTIDLWELRELSLSHGGLLDPKLRKRAWPILTQAMIMTASTTANHNNTSLSSGQQQQQQPISIPSQDVLQIQKDVKRTIWNVKAHFRYQQQQQNTASLQTQLPNSSNGETNRRVKFSDDSHRGNHYPDTIDRVETSTSHSNEEDNGNIENSKPDPQHDDKFDDDDHHHHHYTSTMTSSFAGSTNSRRSATTSSNKRMTKASKHEQRTVTNVIVSCLRNIPPPVSSVSTSSTEQAMTDPPTNRLRYYTGFHDLTALIMVNVESLSISALLLTKLAIYHLRDALRKDRVVLDTAMKLIFFPLLKSIDVDLFQHLVGQDVDNIKKLFSFIIYGISNWFATDIVDIASASRLIDVFLVSHPTAPIYCTIAIFVSYREAILTSSDMNKTIRTLPLFQWNREQDEGSTSVLIATVEQIVSMTLSYMKCYQPSALLELNETAGIWSDEIRKQLTENISAITMLTGMPPTWCNTDMSPNEWTIIQNAIQGNISDDRTMNVSSGRSLAKYPLAVAALGIEIPLETYINNAMSAKNKHVVATLLAIIAIIMLHYGPSLLCGNAPIDANRELSERASSKIPDFDTSCLDAQLLESTSIGILSDKHVTMDEKLETLSNASMAFVELILADDDVQDMIMVPSMSSLTDNAIDIITENVTTTAATDISNNTVQPQNQFIHERSIDPETDVELVVEREILEFVHFLATKMEKRLRAFVKSRAVHHLRQSFESLTQEISSMRKALVVDIVVEPLTDIELAFQQEILDLVQFRAQKMERRLQALATSPTTHHLQQTIASRTNKGFTILHSHLLKIVNLVQDSSLLEQAVALIAVHGNLVKVWLHNRTIQLHNKMTSIAIHVQSTRGVIK